MKVEDQVSYSNFWSNTFIAQNRPRMDEFAGLDETHEKPLAWIDFDNDRYLHPPGQ